MSNNREFSILKWVIFPLMAIVLAGIVAWFNYNVFGLIDGGPAIAAVALIAFFSIAINKFTNSRYRTLAIAAFTCEVFLTIVLIASAAYSLYVQRGMSVARQDSTARVNELKELRGLDRQSRREAIKRMGNRTGAVQVFSANEAWLFWLLIAELSTFAICAFVLYGIAQVLERRDDQIRQPQKWGDGGSIHIPKERMSKEDQDEFNRIVPVGTERHGSAIPEKDRQKLADIANKYNRPKSSRVATQERVHFDAGENSTKKATRVATQTLEECLHVIAEGHPGFHFKVGRKRDGILIRLYSKDKGRDIFEYGRKYPYSIEDGVNEPRYIEALESALARDGFKFERKGRVK